MLDIKAQIVKDNKGSLETHSSVLVDSGIPAVTRSGLTYYIGKHVSFYEYID